ncbi:MAG TPA: DUF6167 family protein [Marmoricola sp.]|nr:DUF6167 family protein [Marmoricola sp.]
MTRAVWFLAGAGAGVYAMVKARRAAEVLTPEGLRDRLAAFGVGAHLFGEEVRVGMAERESELRRRLGLALDGPPALAARGEPGPENGPENEPGIGPAEDNRPDQIARPTAAERDPEE